MISVGVLRDIGAGGCYVLSSGALETKDLSVGGEFLIKYILPGDEEALTMNAAVTRIEVDGRGALSGFALRFIDLEKTIAARLTRFTSQKLETQEHSIILPPAKRTVLDTDDVTQKNRGRGPDIVLPVSGEPSIIIIAGTDTGRRFFLSAEVTTIGRGEKADVQIDDGSISRLHACILRQADRTCLLEDMGSTNGTKINRQPVTRKELRDGDVIGLGDVSIKFLSGTTLEAAIHEDLYRQSTTDALTGALNKRYMLETLDREAARMRRHGRGFGLVMFDVDGFKGVNDTYGHLAGDSFLRELCELVRNLLRREDLLGRYGGDEFMLLLPEADYAAALAVGNKICTAVATHTFTYEGHPLDVSVSAGVYATTAEADGTASIEELIARVDERMYTAKRSGRNCVIGA